MNFEYAKYFPTIIAFAVMTACQTQPDVSSPQKYDSAAHGISFSYPGNWQKSDESDGYLSFEPISGWENSVLMLLHFDKASNPYTLNSLAAELETGRASAASEVSHGLATVGPTTSKTIPSLVKATKTDALQRNFDVSALGESAPHIEQIHEVEGARRVVYVVTQSPTDEWDRTLPGYQLVYDTIRVE